MSEVSFPQNLRGKTVTVLGYGISNRPLVRLLTEAGIAVTVRDKNQLPEIPGAVCISGPDYLKGITEDVIFRTPGIRPDAIVRPENSLLTSEMETFLSLCPCPVTAITGSDGKTTTSTLISELLKASGKRVWLGGNIGTPLLEQLPNIRPEDAVVVELSSFQLMSLRERIGTAVITNIRPNHLDWHLDMTEYAEAKTHVFLSQLPGDLLVLNADDEGSHFCAALAKGTVNTFSRQEPQKNGCYFDGTTVYYHGEPWLERSEILLPGLHNVENWMAAISAVGEQVGKEICRQVAGSFRGVEHRLEPVREKDGITWLNDSIASSPSRTIAGLRALADRTLVLIAGGYDKHIPYDDIGPEICKNVRLLVLCGPTAPKIRAAVEAVEGKKPEIVETDSFDEAVWIASKSAVSGETVLLSPASASFDRFKNFEERGNHFKDLVLAL